jgi:hypothetical protein
MFDFLRNFCETSRTKSQHSVASRFAANGVHSGLVSGFVFDFGFIDLQRRWSRSNAVTAAILGRFFSSSLPPWFALGRFAGLFSTVGDVTHVR